VELKNFATRKRKSLKNKNANNIVFYKKNVRNVFYIGGFGVPI